MKFVSNIPSTQFDAFVATHNKNHFLQSSHWGEFKACSSEWTYDLVGLVDDDQNLIAAALVLFRMLPIIKRPFIYIPRGFVIDFNDKALLNTFTKEMAHYAKSKKAIFFKIDPDIKYVDRDVEGNILTDATPNQELIQSLKQTGFRHLGFTQDFDSSIQPRFTFRLNLTQTEKELLANCHSKTRYNIKIAQKKGIEIVEGTREDIKTFEEIMRVTGLRDGFLTRPLSYFEQMYDTLSPQNMCKLYLAKLNTKAALENLKEELTVTQSLIAQYESQLNESDLNDKKRTKLANKLEPEKNKANNLTQQLVEVERLFESHPDGITMSGIMATYFGNKAWYLYGASDNVYREFMPNYLIQWHALTEAKAAGYEVYDFFGVSGNTDESDPLHGLYRFKKGFGGEFTEFIGEFDYVVSPLGYFIWTKLLPQFKKFKKILRKRKTK
ncbi:MAG TPA: peptidoglycan bridge formation protein FemAB [Firmicutes bacterium]|nr:peptidoglycan bridge formation protein FemAB [Bacillota bacterium]